MHIRLVPDACWHRSMFDITSKSKIDCRVSDGGIGPVCLLDKLKFVGLRATGAHA
ncbi:MAG TPA: hypothetical protein VGJ55_07245 [Pyrinomonadaceae bacterium]